MNVLFTFEIKEMQKEELDYMFPKISFHFNKKPQDVEIENTTIIVTYGEDINLPLLERAKSLEWIMVASAGLEKMPLDEIAKRGIVVSNVRGIHKTPMAESVLAHILAQRRSLPLIYERQKVKEWNKRVGSTELKGSTAIILGPGAIGSEIGRLLQAFGVYTIGCNRSGRECQWMDEVIPLNDLIDKLPVADYIIAILPSTKETIGLLTAEHFMAMKETAVFMNFGRGDLFHEEILVNALKSDIIGHAVLDVFAIEPLPAESELWALSNCTISPHASSFSGKYVERSLEIFKENLTSWVNGNKELINLIDAKNGY